MLGGLIHNSHYDGFPLIMQINHAGPLGGGWGGGGKHWRKDRLVPRVKHLCQKIY